MYHACTTHVTPKGGLVASLPARTSVVAAANPLEGHYNRGKPLADNLKIIPAMLSRWVGRWVNGWVGGPMGKWEGENGGRGGG